MIEIALSCIQRGWYVFPCKPKTKEPLTYNGYLDASNSESQVRAWWTKWPRANVAIATGASGLAVLDCDHGNATEEDARSWMAAEGLPETFTVRTGRRWDPEDQERKPEYGVQLYYAGSGTKSKAWKNGSHSGDVRCSTGYVMAAGSIHDKSGEAYEVLIDAPVVPVLDMKAFTRERKVSLPSADGKLSVLLAALVSVGWPHEMSSDGTKIHVECPFGDHEPGGVSSTTLFIKDGWYCFKCQHSHCSERSYRHFTKEVQRCTSKI